MKSLFSFSRRVIFRMMNFKTFLGSNVFQIQSPTYQLM